MSTKEQLEGQKTEVAQLPAALLRQFAEMAAAIPEVQPDGGASLIERILNAGTEEELSAAFGTSTEEEMLGRKILVEKLERMKSDYPGGLGHFFVIHYYDSSTTRRGVFTSGSLAVLAELARAHFQGWIPLHCMLQKADTPTRSGFYPHHLKILPNQPKRASAPAAP